MYTDTYIRTYIKGSMLVLVMINKWRLFSCVAIRNSPLPNNQVELAFTEGSRSALLVIKRDLQMQVMDDLTREKFSKYRIQLMVLGTTMHDS